MCTRLTSAVACALALALPHAGQAAAQPGSGVGDAVSRPDSAGRVTRRFTFEEREFNPTDFPLNWVRAQHDPPARIRPGFPLWNQAGLDYTVSRSGVGSVILPTRGGSTSLRLDPGVIPVFPEADYRVIAAVRTAGVDHARARLVARLLDAAGNAIEGSEVGSTPTDTKGEWAPVAVRVRGDAPNAASLQIELLLEQAGPVGDIPFEELEVVPADYEGAAWFDDISVVQVPRIELWADPPGNLFDANERPQVSLLLRDMVGQPLDVLFEALDVSGNVVASERIEFLGGRLERPWVPDLRRYGWYHLRVTARQAGAVVGGASTDLVWRGPTSRASDPAGSDAPVMSVLIEGVPTEGLRELGDLVLDSGVRRVTTDLYTELSPIDDERGAAFSLLANRLFPRSRELSIHVPRLPPGVEGLGGVQGLLNALADPDSPGAAWIDPIFIELGHRVRRWSLGRPGDSVRLASGVPLDDALNRLRDLVPGAELGLPVSPFSDLAPALVEPGRAVIQALGPGVPLDEFDTVLGSFTRAAEGRDLGGWDGPTHIVALDVAESAEVGRCAAIERLVLAALHARAVFDAGGSGARSRAIRLDRAWRWQEGRQAELMPNPEAAAWLTLADALAGRRVVPLDPPAPGVEAVLLAPRDTRSRRDAAAVIWPAFGSDAPAFASIRLADGDVRAVDLSGNSVTLPLEPIGETELRTHRVDLRGGPVYVEGVDADLLRFIASVRLESGLLETRVEGDDIRIGFINPWPGPIRGQYFLVEPGGLSADDRALRDRSWDITPRHGSFAADPGEAVSLEMHVDTSPGVLAGEHTLLLDLEVDAPSLSGSFRVERRLETGLEHLELDLVARYGPGPDGPDAVVYAIVTNTGTETETVKLYAVAPGYAHERSAPMPVAPGSPAVKVFAFDGGRDALAGLDINVGLFIREDGDRLREKITLDAGR